MKKTNNYFIITLAFGSLWGLIELFFGYILHSIALPIAGALLMPVGTLCMYCTYIRTGKIRNTFFVPITAAAIKLLTFFFPPTGGSHLIVNPAAAIILQGLWTLPALLYLKTQEVKIPMKYAYSILVVFFTTIFFYKVSFALFQQNWNLLTGAPVLARLNLLSEHSYFFMQTAMSALILVFMVYPVGIKEKTALHHLHLSQHPTTVPK